MIEPITAMRFNPVIGNAPFVVPKKSGPATDNTIDPKRPRVGTPRHAE
jgi:hypothetical protein